MIDVSRLLDAIEQGDPDSGSKLLPLVYEQLRQLAARKLAQEAQGLSLQPTALVHEAYLRLVENGDQQRWSTRGHFFAAAAEAMRRILVENARRKGALKRGGGRKRIAFEQIEQAATGPDEDVLALDEALDRFAEEDPRKAELVKLRFFGGLSLEDAARCLGISRATACRHLEYARSWLYDYLCPEDEAGA